MTEVLKGQKFKCALCNGSGIQPRSFTSRCLACRGKGMVEFDEPAIQCPSCKGKGRVPPSFLLSCIQCRGVGVIKTKEREQDEISAMKGRLDEITDRLGWVKKEIKEKRHDIEKKVKLSKPVAKEIKKEVKEEVLWLKKLGSDIKKTWESLWED